jgi:hypothetical protein
VQIKQSCIGLGNVLGAGPNCAEILSSGLSDLSTSANSKSNVSR